MFLKYRQTVKYKHHVYRQLFTFSPPAIVSPTRFGERVRQGCSVGCNLAATKSYIVDLQINHISQSQHIFTSPWHGVSSATTMHIEDMSL